MGLKFRGRQKIFPGFYVNFSTSGISTTLGIKGFNVNINQNGAYLNTGIPGTGIYDRKKIQGWNDGKSIPQESEFQTPPVENYFVPEKLRGEIKSKNASEVTTEGLVELKQTLVAANKELLAIKKEIRELEKRVKNSNSLRIASKVIIIGFLIKWFDDTHPAFNSDLLGRLDVNIKNKKILRLNLRPECPKITWFHEKKHLDDFLELGHKKYKEISIKTSWKHEQSAWNYIYKNRNKWSKSELVDAYLYYKNYVWEKSNFKIEFVSDEMEKLGKKLGLIKN